MHLAWYFAVQRRKEPHIEEEYYPEKDPLLALSATPSMKATLKYFWVVTALCVVQIAPWSPFRLITQVEGSGFYGFPIQLNGFPYSVVSNLAYTIRYFVDCHGMAGNRIVYWLLQFQGMNQSFNEL